MQDVFEEWDAYVLQRQPELRVTDLERIEADFRLKIVALTGIRRSGKCSLLILLTFVIFRHRSSTRFELFGFGWPFCSAPSLTPALILVRKKLNPSLILVRLKNPAINH